MKLPSLPTTYYFPFKPKRQFCEIQSSCAPELSILPGGTAEQTKLLATEHPLESEVTATESTLKQEGQNL